MDTSDTALDQAEQEWNGLWKQVSGNRGGAFLLGGFVVFFVLVIGLLSAFGAHLLGSKPALPPPSTSSIDTPAGTSFNKTCIGTTAHCTPVSASVTY